MNQSKKNIDSVSVSRATDMAISWGNSTVLAALGFMRDDRRKERLAACECKTCFYIRASRIGGAAMTTRPCGVCDTEVMYGSTNTDDLCMPCATKHQLCKYCGGDLLMRPRRIWWNKSE